METKTVQIKPAFSFGWQSTKKDLWYFVGIAVIIMVLSGLFGMLGEDNFLFTIIGWVVSIITTCGILRLSIDYVRGTKREIKILFTEWQYFWRVIGAMILTGILIVLGFIALIVPGIYLILRFQFVMFLIIDKNMKIGDAMKESARMTKDIKWNLFKFWLASIGIIILGVLALFVGLFVAVPIVWLAQAYLYNSLLQNKAEEEPKIEQPTVSTN